MLIWQKIHSRKVNTISDANTVKESAEEAWWRLASWTKCRSLPFQSFHASRNLMPAIQLLSNDACSKIRSVFHPLMRSKLVLLDQRAMHCSPSSVKKLLDIMVFPTFSSTASTIRNCTMRPIMTWQACFADTFWRVYLNANNYLANWDRTPKHKSMLKLKGFSISDMGLFINNIIIALSNK